MERNHSGDLDTDERIILKQSIKKSELAWTGFNWLVIIKVQEPRKAEIIDKVRNYQILNEDPAPCG
jgi:hypothetical protein